MPEEDDDDNETIEMPLLQFIASDAETPPDDRLTDIDIEVHLPPEAYLT